MSKKVYEEASRKVYTDLVSNLITRSLQRRKMRLKATYFSLS